MTRADGQHEHPRQQADLALEVDSRESWIGSMCAYCGADVMTCDCEDSSIWRDE
jgi:hypothetical protein